MSSTPGVINPTTIGPLGGTPRESAMIARANANNFQNTANAMSGGKYRRFKGGNGIAVAQFNLPYPEQNGPGTGINNQVQDLNKISTQGAANSAMDNLATVKTGGFAINKKKAFSHKKNSNSRMAGGNPDWTWPCYSGGKHHRKTRRNCRKSRKSKKSKKSRKH